MSDVFIDPQLTQLPPSTARRLPSITFFRTQPLLEPTASDDFGQMPSPAAQEILRSRYWTSRIVIGVIESSEGHRIPLDEYLSNPE